MPPATLAAFHDSVLPLSETAPETGSITRGAAPRKWSVTFGMLAESEPNVVS